MFVILKFQIIYLIDGHFNLSFHVSQMSVLQPFSQHLGSLRWETGIKHQRPQARLPLGVSQRKGPPSSRAEQEEGDERSAGVCGAISTFYFVARREGHYLRGGSVVTVF